MFNYTDEYVNKLKEKLGIPKDKKVILYAPTFRQKIPENAERIDFDSLVETLEKTTKSLFHRMLQEVFYEREAAFPAHTI